MELQLAAPVEFWLFTGAVVAIGLVMLTAQALVDHWRGH
jgi:hypothetical protein